MRTSIRKKYEKFAREYVIDCNGTRAAIAVGYSPKAAASEGSRLLTNAKVSVIVGRLLAQQAERADVTAERIINGLRQCAFFDPRKFFNADGSLKQVNELDDDTASAIAGIEVEKLYEHFGSGKAKQIGTVTKIKFTDRQRALELLGKHFKLYTDRQEISASDDLLAALEKAWKRVNAPDQTDELR